jgi:LEA14-like dessication related protein
MPPGLTVAPRGFWKDFHMKLIPLSWLRSWCVVAATAWAIWTAGCARPKVESIGMNVQRIDFQGVLLKFDVTVSNPLPVDLAVPAGGYEVDIAGQDFIKSDRVPHAELPSGGAGHVTLPVALRYVDLFKLANNLRGKSSIPYEMHGHVLVPVAGEQLRLPFSQQGDVPILTMPTFTMRDVKYDGKSVFIETEVTNPNIFPIGVQDLDFAVRLGAIQLANVRTRPAEMIPAGGSGLVTLTSSVNATGAARQMLQSVPAGGGLLQPRGVLRTPYGTVRLPE